MHSESNSGDSAEYHDDQECNAPIVLPRRSHYHAGGAVRNMVFSEITDYWRKNVYYYSNDLLELTAILSSKLLVYNRTKEGWFFYYNNEIAADSVFGPLYNVPPEKVLSRYAIDYTVDTITMGGPLMLHAVKSRLGTILIDAMWLIPLHVYTRQLRSGGDKPPKKRASKDKQPERDFGCDFLHFLKYPAVLLAKEFPESLSPADEKFPQAGSPRYVYNKHFSLFSTPIEPASPGASQIEITYGHSETGVLTYSKQLIPVTQAASLDYKSNIKGTIALLNSVILGMCSSGYNYAEVSRATVHGLSAPLTETFILKVTEAYVTVLLYASSVQMRVEADIGSVHQLFKKMTEDK